MAVRAAERKSFRDAATFASARKARCKVSQMRKVIAMLSEEGLFVAKGHNTC